MDAFLVPALLDEPSAEIQLPTPDLIFFDPPYSDFQKGGEVRMRVWRLFCDLASRLAPLGCAIVHTPKGILTMDECAILPGIVQRDYGSTSLYWWHKPEPSSVESTDS
jgi:16S rRNA G966 N2-methylase RsmD